MASFQQISLGIICLVAAFAFGSYVNNRPAGENALLDAAGNRLDGSLPNQAGNVKSRLSLDELAPVNKRPAPIATMRDPLPPPSQLSFNSPDRSSNKSMSMPTHSQHANQKPAAGLQIPDFSTIAAEFKNTPIELPPLGAASAPSNLANNQPPSSPPKLLDPISKPGTSLRTQTQPDRQSVGTDRWDIQSESKLTLNDFAPKLKDRFTSRSAPTRSPSTLNVDPVPSPKITVQSPPKSQPFIQADPQDPPATIASNLTGGLPRTRSGGNVNSTNLPDARNEFVDPAAPAQSADRVRAKLPFGLTEQSKSELARLRSSADSKLGLQTTRFVDHVVQSGETLQSISTRYFGKPDFYLDIYLANRNKLRSPAVVPAGITVRVPMYQ